MSLNRLNRRKKKRIEEDIVVEEETVHWGFLDLKFSTGEGNK